MGKRLRTAIGAAMIAVGAIQTVLYGVQGEVVPTALGATFGVLGVAYLWIEVYGAESDRPHG
ncbi:hypothetical protein J2751_001621 [Halorubrum alkaliphilum]|uniref:Uncharacterized protein n=1 Tax=Halorubrum alkaliphilum TaxID=261290 RepID=A0A8T4GDS5_9EURY|nr:hypothetical protein [Halorubrum alkaliphilum]MBP1922608.1 hypothetical protein [Halorubrum alkaliphilum]